MASSEATPPTVDRPTIGFTLTDGIIIVKVGADGKKYYVHKALLSHHSAFFAKALKGSWKEAREGVVTLEDVEPAIFNLYMHWLYNQELPPTEEVDDWNQIMEIPSSTDQEDMISKLKAYVLADRFLDPDFKGATAQSIIAQTDRYSWSPMYISEFVTWAFENIPSDRPILQLLVNELCHYWDDWCLGLKDVPALKEMPPEFTIRTLLRLRELAHRQANDHNKACYLEHASKDEIKACDKLFHVHYDKDEDYGYLYNKRETLEQRAILERNI